MSQEIKEKISRIYSMMEERAKLGEQIKSRLLEISGHAINRMDNVMSELKKAYRKEFAELLTWEEIGNWGEYPLDFCPDYSSIEANYKNFYIKYVREDLVHSNCKDSVLLYEISRDFFDDGFIGETVKSFREYCVMKVKEKCHAKVRDIADLEDEVSRKIKRLKGFKDKAKHVCKRVQQK